MAVYNFNAATYTYSGTLAADQFYLAGASHYVYVYGNDGNDYAISGDYNDYMYGGGNNDALYAGRGNDTVDGGSGDDYLSGNIDNGYGQIIDDFYSDTVYGGAGNDVIYAFSYDTAYGGTDNDLYSVIATNSSLPTITEYANEGIDTIALTGYAYAPIDTYYLPNNVENIQIFANVSNVVGNSSDNQMIGNELNNILLGNDGNDVLSGAAGADNLYGGNGNDIIYGGIGDDIIYGNADNDILIGDAGADQMIGGTGNDLYSVDNLGDTVTENANEGYDEVYSTVNLTLPNNVETLFLLGSAVYGTGNSGNNALIGNSADNVLDAGAGATDFINGADGNDLIIGGAGHDEMMGGTGSDTFRYTSPSDGVYDFIYDFAPGQDKIQINSAAFGMSNVTQGVNFFSGGEPTATSQTPTILYNTTYGYLFYDADGSGSQAPQVLAQLNGLPSLQASDFIIY